MSKNHRLYRNHPDHRNYRKAFTTLGYLSVTLLSAVTFANAQAASVLHPGQTLEPGQSLQSPNGKYQAALQSNGDLVVYDDANHTLWHSGTEGTDASRLVMQDDGNLVLYSANYVPRWHTSTFNHGNDTVEAVLQDTGDLTLLTANGTSIWASQESDLPALAGPSTTPALLREQAAKTGAITGAALAAAAGPSLTVNRKTFFDGVRANFGRLKQAQVDGINFLLASMEKDTRPAWKISSVWIRQIAYLFSTVKHEVANTYQPIEEYGNTLCKRYEGGCTYKGRGYVQLTHRSNYRKMSPVVGVDLVAHPTRALEPKIAYPVMSQGMFYGMFTGKKLGSYIKQGSTDYVNARRVVNGTDRAETLAGYARTFQGILERAVR